MVNDKDLRCGFVRAKATTKSGAVSPTLISGIAKLFSVLIVTGGGILSYSVDAACVKTCYKAIAAF